MADALTAARARVATASAAYQAARAELHNALEAEGVALLGRGLPADLAAIRDLVAAEFDLRPSQLHLNTRSNYIAWPRQVAMSLCLHHTGHGDSIITRAFGLKHGNAYHADIAVRARMETEIPTRQRLHRLAHRVPAALAHLRPSALAAVQPAA